MIPSDGNWKEELSPDFLASHDKTDLTELTALLKAGVSAFHTIRYSAGLLAAHGFEELPLSGPWKLTPGKGYFVNVFDSTLAGFVLGADAAAGQNRQTVSPGSDAAAPAQEEPGHTAPRLRICASHTDWPCLMVKPSPEQTTGPYARLNVAVYGGPILNTWLDRPLSLAGKVCVKGPDPFHPQVHLVDFGRPLLTIPNLPIHFNREVNKGMELNPQVDMQPILGILDETLNRDHFFLNLLAQELHAASEDILDYQFCLYNCDEPQLLGMKKEMLSSPRLDNLTSVQACLSGLLASKREHGICAAVLYDNEEIGSSTKQGAASPILEHLLEKLYESLGLGRSDLLNDLFDGFLLSLDVAHALHPTRTEKYDPVDRIAMNEGVAIKLAVSQAYATDASYVSVVEGLCRQGRIPYRKFTTRSDIRGGSTLGSISSCLLTMPAVDIGVPILAMHSSRELMGTEDQWALAELTRRFMA